MYVVQTVAMPFSHFAATYDYCPWDLSGGVNFGEGLWYFSHAAVCGGGQYVQHVPLRRMVYLVFFCSAGASKVVRTLARLGTALCPVMVCFM